MTTPLPLPELNDLPDSVQKRLKKKPPINVYRMIANAPPVLIPWTDLVGALYESEIPIRFREIAILRQAAKAKSEYELHQHKLIAKANGITDKEIATIIKPGTVAALSEKENLICQMADEIEHDAGVSQRTRDQLQTYFPIQQLTELIILTSFYCCVARVLNSTGVEIEDSDPLAGKCNPN